MVSSPVIEEVKTYPPVVIVGEKEFATIYKFTSQANKLTKTEEEFKKIILKEELKEEINNEYPHILMVSPIPVGNNRSAEKFMCFSCSADKGTGNVITLNLGEHWCDQDADFSYFLNDANGFKKKNLDGLLEERLLIHHLPSSELVLDYHLDKLKGKPCLEDKTELIKQFGIVYRNLLDILPEI
ncbi:MAG: hypothetical protein PHT54_00225 [Candidatus Nanoarchaeia archaeon]|nr:hypothetical protein [Candidatus Nanoarchaeia archaeon]